MCKYWGWRAICKYNVFLFTWISVADLLSFMCITVWATLTSLWLRYVHLGRTSYVKRMRVLRRWHDVHEIHAGAACKMVPNWDLFVRTSLQLTRFGVWESRVGGCRPAAQETLQKDLHIPRQNRGAKPFKSASALTNLTIFNSTVNILTIC